jgi:hypothetical protein
MQEAFVAGDDEASDGGHGSSLLASGVGGDDPLAKAIGLDLGVAELLVVLQGDRQRVAEV